MRSFIVDLDEVVEQAQERVGLPAVRRAVEAKLCEARERLKRRFLAEGRQARNWGFTTRKTLQTPYGDLGPLRIPRLRVDGKEARLLPRQVRRVGSFEALTAEATLGGISQRRTGGFLARATGQPLSAATVGRIVAEVGASVEARRQAPLRPGEHVALVADAVWGRYRGAGDAALLVGIGVRDDGSFEVLDWEADVSENTEAYTRLFTRLEARGLREPELIAGDGAAAIPSARDWVYPSAEFQLCLWHWSRTLRPLVYADKQRRFSRDFWEVYDGLDAAEVRARAARFRRRWRRSGDLAAIAAFDQRFEETLGYLRFPETWRHRVRTVNLAEGFFRNLRRFLCRWPGFKDAAHLSRVLGLYLLSAEPERIRRLRLRVA